MRPHPVTRTLFWLNVGCLAAFALLQQRDFWPVWKPGTPAADLLLVETGLLLISYGHAVFSCLVSPRKIPTATFLLLFGAALPVTWIVGRTLEISRGGVWFTPPHYLGEDYLIAFLLAGLTTAILLIMAAAASPRKDEAAD